MCITLNKHEWRILNYYELFTVSTNTKSRKIHAAVAMLFYWQVLVSQMWICHTEDWSNDPNLMMIFQLGGSTTNYIDVSIYIYHYNHYIYFLYTYIHVCNVIYTCIYIYCIYISPLSDYQRSFQHSQLPPGFAGWGARPQKGQLFWSLVAVDRIGWRTIPFRNQIYKCNLGGGFKYIYFMFTHT